MLHTLYGQAMKHNVQFFGEPAETLEIVCLPAWRLCAVSLLHCLRNLSRAASCRQRLLPAVGGAPY